MDITKSLGVATVLVILYSFQATAQLKQTANTVRCIGKLLPCHEYINSDSPPPPWCCHPVKDIVENDVSCLCEAFKHPDMLAMFRLTIDDGLSLISSCGSNFDASVCTDNTASSPDGSTSSESSSASTKKKAAALGISLLGVSFIWL